MADLDIPGAISFKIRFSYQKSLFRAYNEQLKTFYFYYNGSRPTFTSSIQYPPKRPKESRFTENQRLPRNRILLKNPDNPRGFVFLNAFPNR